MESMKIQGTGYQGPSAIKESLAQDARGESRPVSEILERVRKP